MVALARARAAVNVGLRPLGVQVVRGRSTNPAVAGFIPARATIAAARRAGLSVGDFIDRTYAVPGATATAVEAVLRLGSLTPGVERVCEIGPGSGRYLERFAQALRPTVYEVYEPAEDWHGHLRSLADCVVLRPCDGSSLGGTATGSVDLVHAEKVFVYLSFWTVAGYLAEMARVVRPGGVVAFDILSEQCLDEQIVDRGGEDLSIMRPVPRGWVIDFLGRRGLSLRGSDFTPLPPGRSEIMVFRRD